MWRSLMNAAGRNPAIRWFKSNHALNFLIFFENFKIAIIFATNKIWECSNDGGVVRDCKSRPTG